MSFLSIIRLSLKGQLDLLKKVVFLDRDGTINRDSHDYIKSREEFEFLPGSLKAIEALTANGFTIFVITNQSALPRKLISIEELERLHAMMCKIVQSNEGKIEDIFYCPICRRMIVNAANQHRV